ncbi:stage II sporulation protein M [Brachybacterium sp. J153]|uniref:stage II sporulation protein M n=1 Tax=Brachybacterium sp. J153 TaxID=3116488 RepID=UPI002E78460D|nr:stage II sporulation protein M [Brachybacterium sp. J153]MEE1616902.1 stage II sporulation protein M [Brachybacterium sp. J153]
MDTDAFISVHRPQWDRLRELTRARSLSAAEIEELLALYQETSTHLSTVRSTAPDPALISRLSLLVHRARLRITGARVPLWRHAREFFWNDLPSALFQSRWTVALASAVFLVSAVIAGVFFGTDEQARAAVLPEEAQRALVEHDFVAYYFQGEASGFAAQVWTNNAWIAMQAVVFGVTGFWPIVMLLQNGLNVGLSAGVMGAHGGLGTFFVFILPHGLLELTAVMVGAGAGLRTFWAWVRPGPMPRSWALSQSARALITIGIGLVPVLLVSGVVEAFVTPSDLPPAVRIGIGAVLWIAFLVFMLGRGRQAHRSGITGDLSEELVGDRVLTAG